MKLGQPYYDISREFQELFKDQLHTEATPIGMERIREQIGAFFLKHNINVSFRVLWEKDSPTVIVEGIREIDRWAIYGLLSQDEKTGYVPKCPECFDKGWLYDAQGKRTGICPCHLE